MKIMLIFLVLVVGTTSIPVAADDISQGELRLLIEKGEVLPLESILKHYPEHQYGKLLDLEVEREGKRLEYELEFLRSDGRVLEIKVDAHNGTLLEQEIED